MEIIIDAQRIPDILNNDYKEEIANLRKENATLKAYVEAYDKKLKGLTETKEDKEK